MSSKKGVAGVDNTFRRTWDTSEFEDKAKEREKREGDGSELTPSEIKKQKRMARDPLHQGLIVKRSNLRARTYDLQLDAKLGKTQIVSAHGGMSQQAGYYCNICDCTLKDNQSWLTHINGKYHNRALGMNLKTERVTVDEVRKTFEELKERKQRGGEAETYTPDGFEAAVKKQVEEEEKAREKAREAKRRKQLEGGDEGEDEEVDPDMMALMGFGNFGGGK